MTNSVFAVVAHQGGLRMGLLSNSQIKKLEKHNFSIRYYAEEFVGEYNDVLDGYTVGAVYIPESEGDIAFLSDETIYRSLSIETKNSVLNAYRQYLAEYAPTQVA